MRRDEGLTDEDYAHLEVVANHTNEVIAAMDIAIARGLEAIGIEAESDAAAICPVDTGRLRNSITHTIDANDKAAIIGTNVSYSLYVHEGVHGRKGQPFLRDAVTKNVSKYRDILKAALGGR